ncbi:MAG: sulfatase-like hydrolase/transferase, partial [Planctomycetota bacterium]
DTVSDRGVAWLEAKAAAHDGRPWLLWLHYFDPHEVYQLHEAYAPVFGSETDLERYRGEIRWTDEHLGRVLTALEASPFAERTVVALTADHGEEWEDHGELGHGHTLYRELVRVPLLLRAPGLASGRVAERVSLLDLAPTLLDLCGLPPLEGIGGRTLRPLASAPSSEGIDRARGAVLAEVGRSKSQRMAAVGAGDWKLVWHEQDDRFELFDVRSDPLEQRDLSALRPDDVERLHRDLLRLRAEALLDAPLVADEDAAGAGLGAAERSALAELGYVDDAPTPTEEQP